MWYYSHDIYPILIYIWSLWTQFSFLTDIRRCPYDLGCERGHDSSLSLHTHVWMLTHVCMLTLASWLLFWLQGLYGGQLECQCLQRLPSLSLPWECEQACGIDSQQPIPALIAQRQACGTWQRCPMSNARYHKPPQPCLLRCSRGVSALKGDTSACATEAPHVFSFPPLVDSCLSSAATFRHTFSCEQGDKPVLHVINTIVNCTLKAGLPDSTHHVTGIMCTTEKLPILLYIIPSINIRGNTLANYGLMQAVMMYLATDLKAFFLA